jgi:protein tyrosine phosphatase (PTP) superfamily phosphohydrolase (DUF442 family)
MQNSKTVLTWAAVLLSLSLVASAQTAVHQPQIDVNAGVGKLSQIRIENFGRISPNYYRGAQPSDRDYNDLAGLGIKTVVNLTSHDAVVGEKTRVEATGMTYFHIPMTTRVVPTPAQIAAFLGIVTAPARQPVYIHCVGGKHRTGVMTAVYRMSQEGWPSDRAFKEMKQYKFGADFLHPEFKQFVYGYQPSSQPLIPELVAAAPQVGATSEVVR